MNDVKTYLRKLQLRELEHLLGEFCQGRGNVCMYAALDICFVLAENDPEKPDVDEAFRRFCAAYL